MSPLPDDWAIDPETADLLRSLIAQENPQVIVECGAWPGASTKVIREAMNGAEFRSYESNGPYREEVNALPTPPDFRDADLSFIDCITHERRLHFKQWQAEAKPGAVCVVHDADHYQGWADWQQVVSEYVSTPTGTRICRKERDG